MTELALQEMAQRESGGRRAGYLAAALAAVTGSVLLHFYAPNALHLPPCVFHELTGLYCPGCGAARALHHLMNLEFPAATRSNLLFVAALPFLLCAFAIKAIGAFSLRWSPEIRFSSRTGWLTMAAILGWWILRNLPWFTFLAPS